MSHVCTKAGLSRIGSIMKTAGVAYFESLVYGFIPGDVWPQNRELRRWCDYVSIKPYLKAVKLHVL